MHQLTLLTWARMAVTLTSLMHEEATVYLQGLELRFCCFAIVQAEMVARLPSHIQDLISFPFEVAFEESVLMSIHAQSSLPKDIPSS